MTNEKFTSTCLMVIYGFMFSVVNSEGHSFAWRLIGSVLVILLAVMTAWFSERKGG